MNPINQVGMVPRLVNGGPLSLDRQKFLTGEIPVYYGPMQPLPTSVEFGVTVPDPTQPCSAPGDWPVGGALLRMPVTVRVLYSVGDGFSAEGGTQAGSSIVYNNAVAVAQAWWASVATALQDALESDPLVWFGVFADISDSQAGAGSSDFFPYIDFPSSADLSGAFLGGACVNIFISDGLGGADVQFIDGSFVDVGDGPYDPSDPTGDQASFVGHYPDFALSRTIVVIDQNYIDLITQNAQWFDAFESNSAVTQTYFTRQTAFQASSTQANIESMCEAFADSGFSFGGMVSSASTTAEDLLSLAKAVIPTS